jgi:apolipoprotein N-acyltransferase
MESRTQLTADPTLNRPSVAPPLPEPVRAPVPARAARPLLVLTAPLLTAAALWASFFPLAQGWLIFFALVPILSFVRTPARPRFVYLLAWLGGLAFFVPALQWLRVADWRMMAFAWPGLALYCSLYFPVAIFLLRFLDRRSRLPLTLTLPVVWVALEYVRSFLLGGFAWYFLGYALHDYLPIIQIADLGGVYAVSFLVAAVNGLFFEAAYALPWYRRMLVGAAAAPSWGRWVLFGQAAAVVAVASAALGYGEWRLSQFVHKPGPRVALIQGNVPQQIRNDGKAAGVMTDHFALLSRIAAGQNADLIVWPETSYIKRFETPTGPVYVNEWEDVAADAPAADVPVEWKIGARFSRVELAAPESLQAGTNVLLGLDAAVWEAEGHARRYNSAVLIDKDGECLGRYDKIHCVPFGEYVPFRDALPFLQKFAPYDDGDLNLCPGRETTHFPLNAGAKGAFTFGVVICYEDTDPQRARPYLGGDGRPPVDFLLNTSNDGWFDGTCEHDEHLAMCRFRAVECRRTVARAVNMGISAVIDGNGEVLNLEPDQAGPTWETIKADPKMAELFPDEAGPLVWRLAHGRNLPRGLPTYRWSQFKKAAGVLVAEIPLDRRESFYVRWGDWLPWACWLTLGGGIVVGILRRKTSVPAGG